MSEYAATSTPVAASAAVSAVPALVFGATLTAGADTATLIIYDNTAASGTIRLKLSATANTTAASNFSVPAVCSIGVYAAVTGTAPAANVLWRKV